MAARNFDRCFALTLRHEGGYVDHPSDPGGATNLGVTIGTLSRWYGRPASKAEVRALTKADVAPIYRKNFWYQIRGDDLPSGVDYAVYDFAVNSGPSRGVKALQRAVGVAADGIVGPATLGAAAAAPSEKTIRTICAARMTFLRGLKTWPTFGKGWSRRVNGVIPEALALVRADAPAPEPIRIVVPTAPPKVVAAASAKAKPGFWRRLAGAFDGFFAPLPARRP